MGAGAGAAGDPRTGGTFEVSGTADSLTQINDARAIAASVHATAYERCDEQLSCSLFMVTAASDAEIPLPFAAGAKLHLSPEGHWLVVEGEGTSALMNINTSLVAELMAGDVTAVDWAPDETFVAIARGASMQILFPESRETLSLELDTAPDQSSLLVFTATGAS